MIAHDVHKRKVRIYQWFTGLDPSDMFLVFVGWINTPTSWSERDRTVKITVVSRIEDLEIGFSVGGGEFSLCPLRPGGQGVADGLRHRLRLSGPEDTAGRGRDAVGAAWRNQSATWISTWLTIRSMRLDRRTTSPRRSIQKEWYHWSVVNSAAQCWMDVDAKKYADFSSQAQKITGADQRRQLRNDARPAMRAGGASAANRHHPPARGGDGVGRQPGCDPGRRGLPAKHPRLDHGR